MEYVSNIILLVCYYEKSAIVTILAVWAKNVRHVGHLRWLGPNVWWEISQIYTEYKKLIRQMSDGAWKFFTYTVLARLTWNQMADRQQDIV